MTQPQDDQYAETADFYDEIAPYRERGDVQFFVDLALEADGPVLEAGCGTGRVLLPTARAGVAITGLDYSDAMLDVCRAKVAREPESVARNVSLVQGDMRAFDLGRKFSLITLPFRPFQHLLTVEDQLAALGRMHAHLMPGGRLVLDIYNPMLERLVDGHYLTDYEVEPKVTLPDGRSLVRKGRTISRDLAEQTQEIQLLHELRDADGHVERTEQYITLRYFFRFEVEHLLARAGFEVEQRYGGYDKCPIGAVYPGELLFVARKQP